ncbi:prolyl oligopeptidase family serine peptidase [Mucilaginibacter sp. Bleaf8]|uniref:carboxylesterase family protein n=1 Tax=Mucilaginibacter sp. Bleaf8 TaxID=2834430 RepID=UPI001BCB62B4|nr:prolyl oligopeptidase family serine peptidase [Mucilaginibacter sp. Bleaf8]MBS7566013.1 prolyl oligopeptidase family serine peptidase [Mucilaginibacter sp. Bleaf8]
MKKLTLLVVLIVTLSGVQSLTIAQTLADYRKEVYHAKGDTLPYRVLLPENFDAAKKYSLMLVLHGSGERGNDNEAQLTHGGKLFLDTAFRQKFAAIVVFPQCPKDSYWSNVEIQPATATHPSRTFNFRKGGKPTKAMHALQGLLSNLLHQSYINKDQVYVGGLSMGGMGTFELLRRKPKVFAAAFAICGGGSSETVKKFAKRVPVWVFHGAKDDVVPIANSETMVQAIKDAGGNPKYTVYPNANHNSWDNAFAEPELFGWLFSHTKK